MPTIPIATKLRIYLRSFYTYLLTGLYEARGRIWSILSRDKMQMTRLIIGASSITWGLILTGPSDLFTDKRTTYLVMRAMMSEHVWGYLFLVSGTVGLAAVLFGLRNRVTIVFDALLGAALWTASTLACFAAHWPSNDAGWLAQWVSYPAPAAMSGELWLSIAAWWHFVRHVTDYPSCRHHHTRKEDYLP